MTAKTTRLPVPNGVAALALLQLAALPAKDRPAAKVVQLRIDVSGTVQSCQLLLKRAPTAFPRLLPTKMDGRDDDLTLE